MMIKLRVIPEKNSQNYQFLRGVSGWKSSPETPTLSSSLCLGKGLSLIHAKTFNFGNKSIILFKGLCSTKLFDFQFVSWKLVQDKKISVMPATVSQKKERGKEWM